MLAGCPVTPRDEGQGAAQGDEAIEEHSELFVTQGGEPGLPVTTVFQTNDTRYWGRYGYTLWAPTGVQQTPFAGRQVTAAKIGGNAAAGFGVVFCAYDSGTGGETMLVVMINTQQEYIVGEATGGVFRELVPWTTLPALKLGYNQANTIALAPDGGEYVLAINGTEAARFRDDEPPLHTGGADGYLVVISPLDNFPETPVHVVFQEGP